MKLTKKIYFYRIFPDRDQFRYQKRLDRRRTTHTPLVLGISVEVKKKYVKVNKENKKKKRTKNKKKRERKKIKKEKKERMKKQICFVTK